jgi:hypothetical protein
LGRQQPRTREESALSGRLYEGFLLLAAFP